MLLHPNKVKLSNVGRISRVAFATGMAVIFAAVPSIASTSPPGSAAATGGQDLSHGTSMAIPSFAPLVKNVLPAVVNISVVEKDSQPIDDEEDEDDGQATPDQGLEQGIPPGPFGDMLRRFFSQPGMGGQQMTPLPEGHRMALGSGFIIDPSGYVVTNNHVVQGAAKVTVIFQDDTKHKARVIGRDAKTDLALLKIDASRPLPYLQWGNSDTAQVGDWVVAVGNPFGLGGSVSVGVVSARGRDIQSGPYDDYLQLDAPINRGNSGGPAFDVNGKVIGIDTAIYSPNGGSVGIGFAIPSDIAKPVIDQLRAHGHVERGWLGVAVQQVTPDIAKGLNLPDDKGALVSAVTPNGPAAKAGFKTGDLIQSVDGHEITRMRDLPLMVADTAAGTTVHVTILRHGHPMTLEPEIAKMPANPKLAMAEDTSDDEGDTAQALGVKLAPLTDDARQRLQIPPNVNGVVVSSVKPNSKLADIGIQPGDVIQSIDQQPVTTPKEAAEKLAAATKKEAAGKSLLLLLNRQGVNQFVALSEDGASAG